MKGTEKQVKWAKEIRGKLMDTFKKWENDPAGLEYIIEEVEYIAEVLNQDIEIDAETVKVTMENIFKNDDANWWINNRRKGIHELVFESIK